MCGHDDVVVLMRHVIRRLMVKLMRSEALLVQSFLRATTRLLEAQRRRRSPCLLGCAACAPHMYPS
jgi:hypothetical protein